jgi:hypothetical protein
VTRYRWRVLALLLADGALVTAFIGLRTDDALDGLKVLAGGIVFALCAIAVAIIRIGEED